MFEIDPNYQTPPKVAEFMASIASRTVAHPYDPKHNIYSPTALEPTPGLGHLVGALNDIGFTVYGPGNGCFWESWANLSYPGKYDVVVMNPPFTPVKEMERFVLRAMELSDNVIALLPWTYIVNSERRLKVFQDYGLKGVISLPRKTFPGCRVQSMIAVLEKGYKENTYFKNFTW